MVRGGLAAGAAALPVAAGIAFAVRGSEGALAAALALALIVANFAVAGAALAWAARKNAVLFPAVALPSYAFRMLGVLMAMRALREVDVIDHPTFVVTFGVGIVALLGYECWLYTKTPWLALTFSPTKETT